jgi:hypothetical protein
MRTAISKDPKNSDQVPKCCVEKIKGDGQCLNNTHVYRHISFLKPALYQETALVYQMNNDTSDYVKTKFVNCGQTRKKYTSL